MMPLLLAPLMMIVGGVVVVLGLTFGDFLAMAAGAFAVVVGFLWCRWIGRTV